MWILLTTTGKAKVVVNFAEVLHVNEHKNGTQIHFSPTLPSRDGVITSKLLYVEESLASIARQLKASKAD